MLRLPVLGLPVLRLPVLGLPVRRLLVRRLLVRRLALRRLALRDRRRGGVVRDRRSVPGRRCQAERARYGWAILRMAQPDQAVPGDRDLLDPLRADEDAVGAA
jgi:hypothetical protein